MNMNSRWLSFLRRPHSRRRKSLVPVPAVLGECLETRLLFAAVRDRDVQAVDIFAPSTAAQGSRIDVTMTVRNSGRLALSSYVVGFCFDSFSGNLNAQYVLGGPEITNGLFTRNVALAPGETDTFTLQADVVRYNGLELPVMNGYLGVRIKATGGDPLSNNLADQRFQVLPPNANVSVSLSPASVTENGTSNLVYTFKRTGATTNALDVVFAVDGSALHLDDYTTLGDRSFETTYGSVTIPAGASSATLTVDPLSDNIQEFDETVVLTLLGGVGYEIGSSSSATGTILAGPPQPDLAASGLVIPYAYGAAGGTVSVDVAIDNSGMAASGNFDVKFYLVTDFDNLNSAILLTTVSRTSIAAQGRQSWSQLLTLPKSITAGDYAIGFVLDPASRISESDETNNITGEFITIVPGSPRPDFVAPSVMMPDSGAAGTTFTVDAAVQNLGTAASAGFEVKFYLSTDDQITSSDLVIGTVTRGKLAAGGLQEWAQSLSLPKTVNEGEYYIGMIVDPGLKIAELDETNNSTAQGPIWISGPPRPDLAASEFYSNYALGAAGGTVMFNAVVDNAALVASGNFDVKFYLDTDGVIETSDTLLATVSRKSIAASGSQSWTQTLTLPKSLAAGDYFIRMILDPTSRINEADEGNNVGSAQLMVVSGTPRPDFQISGLGPPESAAAGTTITVNASVDNLGTATSGNFEVKFYLSSDDQITSSDLMLKSVTRPKLAAGEFQAWEQSLSLPKSVTEGNYYFGLIVDPASRVAESDETNNTAVQSAIPISGPPRPDLNAAEVLTPEIGSAGGTITVNPTVNNYGLAATGKFDVKFYLVNSDGDVSDPTSGLLLTTVTRNSIAAVQEQSWTQSLSLPKTLADGDYSVVMVLDPANRIGETDESNNITNSGLITVSGPPRPDLVASNLSVPGNGTIGKTISVTPTISNDGTAASGNFDVKFYLSHDDVISSSDVLLATASRTSAGAGASQTWDQTLTIPKALAEGEYHIGILVDPANRIAESDESNNVASYGILFGTEPPPVEIATDDSVLNDRFDFAVGYPIVVDQPFQFTIRGHVGPGTGLQVFDGSDGLDKFSFEFERASTIRVELTNLSVDASAFISSLTPGVGSKGSNNSGLSSEVVTQSFPAGGRADLLIGAVKLLSPNFSQDATTYTLTVTIT